MMAIGAQYTKEPFSLGDSRILHEKCVELITKYKQPLASAGRLDYMQAIFLVEVFSHFRAKRAATQLSEAFLNMYNSLWRLHSNTGRSYVEGLSALQPQLNPDQLRIRWSEWIVTTSFGRLLNACYVFENIQGLVLVRTPQSAPAAGLELFMPAPSALWDAPDHVRWSQLVHCHPTSLIDLAETLDNIWTNTNHVSHFDVFQSMMIVACYAASTLFQKQGLQGTQFSASAATHPVFESDNIVAVERVLSPQLNVISIYSLVRLASNTPLRALLATSGESWVLSQRLSQEALLAAAEFTTLKAEMRAWTETTSEPAFFQGSTGDNIRAAVQHALNIVKTWIEVESTGLPYLSDLALYYACLVLWTVTYSAVSKAEATGLKFESNDTTELEPFHAQRNTRTFCDFAEGDLNRNLVEGIISSDRIDAWRFSVGSALRWSSWVLGGREMRIHGVGELMEGAIGVLDRLGRGGWSGDWF
jgi:hypothetical protein